MSSRVMSLTEELVALCHRPEIDEGRNSSLTPLPDEEYEPLARSLVEASASGPLWLFAYGSLIWSPIFPSAEGGGRSPLAGTVPFALKWRTGAEAGNNPV